MIVADTNLVAYLLVEGEHTETARRVWARDPAWCLPPLWRSEFLNVLATATRAGGLEEAQAFDAWEAAIGLMGGHEREPGGQAVLRSALARGISAYDAQFVVLAETLDVPLVTCDRKLAVACPGIARTAREFCARA